MVAWAVSAEDSKEVKINPGTPGDNEGLIYAAALGTAVFGLKCRFKSKAATEGISAE